MMSDSPHAPEGRTVVRRYDSRLRGRIGRAGPTGAAFALAALIFLATALYTPGFAGLRNLQQMSIFATFIGLAAVGETVVILAGGLDLSVPWLMTFGGIELGKLDKVAALPGPAEVLILLAIGLAIGLVNGIGVTKFKVPPIIMTLAVGGLIEGYLLAVGTLQSSSSSVPPIANQVAHGKLGPFPTLFLLWLVVAVITAVVLRRTALGRHIYAVGSNERAARLSGLRVERVRLVTYAVAGLTSTLAGIVLSGYLGTSYLDMGTPYLFPAIAAVALGGTAIAGGKGSYWGSVAGALILTLLSAALPLLHLDTADLDIVYGVVILLGVGATNGLVGRTGRRHPVMNPSSGVDASSAHEQMSEQREMSQL